MRIGYKISLLVLGTAILVTAVLTYIGYTTARRQYIAGVDAVLTATAAALPGFISEDYLNSAISGEAPTDGAYRTLVERLSELADRSGVYYAYAFAKDGDN